MAYLAGKYYFRIVQLKLLLTVFQLEVVFVFTKVCILHVIINILKTFTSLFKNIYFKPSLKASQ